MGMLEFTRDNGLKSIANRLRIYVDINYRLVERLREGMDGFG